MQTQSKILKWGNSSAIRLPSKLLSASGIAPNSNVDIQASAGRLVIQLHETTSEQAFDKLFSSIPDTEELLDFVQQRLIETIELTDKTTKSVEDTRKKLSGNKS